MAVALKMGYHIRVHRLRAMQPLDAVISAILSLLQHVRQTGPTLPPLSNFEGWSALPREVAYLVMGADPASLRIM